MRPCVRLEFLSCRFPPGESGVMRKHIPLSKRPVDIAIVAFFLINLLLISYVVDLEGLVIPDPAHFTYPLWPLPFMVDTVHWWGSHFDPLLMARPVWWKVTLLIEDLFFGPFYVVATYAFVAGKRWIRIPSIIYASMLLTIISIILAEEAFGPYRAPQLGMALLSNAAWVVFPIVILIRMGFAEHPFSRVVPGEPSPHGDGA